MLQQWQTVGNTVSYLTGLNFRPPAPETNTLPLDQLAGHAFALKFELEFEPIL